MLNGEIEVVSKTCREFNATHTTNSSHPYLHEGSLPVLKEFLCPTVPDLKKTLLVVKICYVDQRFVFLFLLQSPSP